MAGRAVVLLSGGLDSTTAAALARKEGWAIYALTVNYGQVHAREIDAARRVATWLGAAEHREITVDLSSFGGSSLVGDGQIPKSQNPEIRQSQNPEIPQSANSHIPSTYVPARNTVMLSLALAWAEVIGAERIVIGVNALDYSGYPDCRPEFIRAFEQLARLATKAGVEGRPLTVHTPLISLSKADIVKLGLSLGLDYGLTHSCYDPQPNGRPCGHCDSCRLRAAGFAEAGATDPLMRPRDASTRAKR